MKLTKLQIYFLIGGAVIMSLLGTVFLTRIKIVSYNQVVNSKTKNDDSLYSGRTIKWQGKISAYYSQITGIKFCVVDNDHQNVDIDKPCDWFWASSDLIINANDKNINPNWDGKWVDYILNFYKVDFDPAKRFYDEIYLVEGKINGLDCDVNSRCIPDVEIISIKK